jgi:hypothetical protein
MMQRSTARKMLNTAHFQKYRHRNRLEAISLNDAYRVAWHPPILCSRKQSNNIVRFAMEQLPVDCFPALSMHVHSRHIALGSIRGVTDGTIEVLSESAEEFGLAASSPSS